MLQYFVILLVMFVSQGDTLCEEKGEYTSCSSVHDVRKLKQQQNWTKIYINSAEKRRINEFTFVKTPNVEEIRFRNAVEDIDEFTFYDLSSLRSLELIRCDLPMIKKNWFNDLSSISSLTIYSSNVKSLEPGLFEGSANLTRIHIEGNNISRIVGNVFSGTALQYLSLRRNQIQFIHENAFTNMSHLAFLSLNNNFLKSFIPKVILPNLHRLYLSSNQIEMIPRGALNGLSNLKVLEVSCNKLGSFPESAFPYSGLPSLQEFFLGNNRLNYMPRSLIRYFPKLEKIAIFGNPWQCGCYKDILNSIQYHNVSILHGEEYLNGTRPVCVVPQTGSDTCQENMHMATNLNDYFIQQIQPCTTNPYF